MSVKIIANYAKRLGLPGYSSHQYSVSVEAEVTNLDAVAAESAALYQRLQDAVDSEIQHTGYAPGNDHGSVAPHSTQNGIAFPNGNGSWQCSPKQKELILKIIEENHLDKAEIEALAQDRFAGTGVKKLNRLQASGLIAELLERVEDKPTHSPRRGRQPAYANGGAQ